MSLWLTVAIWILFILFPVISLWSNSLFWTRDGCTGSQQAWQEVDKSKAGGPEKGRKNLIFSFIFSFCVCVLLFQKTKSALAFAVLQLYVLYVEAKG